MKSHAWLLLCGWLCLVSACRREDPVDPVAFDASDDVIMQNDTDKNKEWLFALQRREFEFPRDHAAHPDFRIEWWYYTGNLLTSQGRRFGYQVTFFRTGMQREPTNPSRWAVRDLYTAHFAITDVAERDFAKFERTHRGGVEWAGVSDDGRIWNGDWELRFDSRSQKQTLTARQEGNAIDLVLSPAKPLVLHGDRGLSRKGAAEGNASYYYSFTRLETKGTLTIDGVPFAVEGESWMDHEFSSSFLEKGQQGWDWFSIQLASGEELMLYQMRRADGSADPHSSGTWVDRDGATRTLTRDQFVLEPDRGSTWKSTSTGARYPTLWRVRVPTLQLDLQVEAVIPNQEMDTSASTGIIYWEGCIDVSGTRGDEPVLGRGYLEMTGYTGRGLGEIL